MDTNLIEWPETLPVPLLERTHNVAPKAWRTIMESQRSRNRRVQLTARQEIEVRWNYTSDEYATFKTFFETTLENGALPFLIVTHELSPLDRNAFRTARWELAFKNGNYSFSGSDNLFQVVATLIVIAYDYDKLSTGQSLGGSTTVNAALLVKKHLASTISGETFVLADLFFDIDASFSVLQFDGPTYSILPVGDKVYVTGRFTKYGTESGGWSPCLGIARLLGNGELDTSFHPGGVPGGGFDISDGFYPPTQLQGGSGGIFCAMSYAFLEEPMMYARRGVQAKYSSLSLNGVECPPLIKLNNDGSRDYSFDPTYLVDVAAFPIFMSFHAFELANRMYVSYQRDIACVSVEGVDMASGRNRCTLEMRSMTGTLLKRVYRGGTLGADGPESYGPQSPEFFHQVFVETEGLVVLWSGMRFSLLYNTDVDPRITLGLYQIVDPAEEGVSESIAWLTPDLNLPSDVGVVGFDHNLKLSEEFMWRRYHTFFGAVNSLVPYRMVRGCFYASVVGDVYYNNDTYFGSGDWNRHKGGWHYAIEQRFGSYLSQQGGGFGDITTAAFDISGSDNMFIFKGGQIYHHSFLIWGVDPEDAENKIGLDAGIGGESISFVQVPEFYAEFEPLATNIEITDDSPDGEEVACSYKLWTPVFRPYETTRSDLWDLRSDPESEDPSVQGFDTFPGSDLADLEGCRPIRVLRAEHDPALSEPAFDTVLGVFFTGMIEKFKGIARFVNTNQLCKILHNGVYDTGFTAPIFGPHEGFNLKEDIATGADENHYRKINCAVVSAGGTKLYVGGKFTQLNPDDSSAIEVGHICVLDVNTGALNV